MSRLKRLIENQGEEENLDQSPAFSSGGLGRLGASREVSITTQGPYTESDYTCKNITCQGDGCDETILNVVEPEYPLEVGISTSIPIELIFSKIEGSIREGEVRLWSQHALATSQIYVFDCPECGTSNEYVMCSDNGLLVLTMKYDHVECPIPKDRVNFRNNPRSDWRVDEN